MRGVYAIGADDPGPVDRARGRALAAGAVASGCLAGVLHDLDGVDPGDAAALKAELPRRRPLPPERVVVVAGRPCTDGLQTLVDVAAVLDDARWEQALECVLHRRVLAARPAGARPTESLLETLMVQLARTIPDLGEPVRQYEVYDAAGNLVARVDLAWPELGLFVELDGQHHAGQPLYDARRETAVVAVTGWLCGRFTWYEVVHVPKATARRLAALVDQARRRPPAAAVAAV